MLMKLLAHAVGVDTSDFDIDAISLLIPEVFLTILTVVEAIEYILPCFIGFWSLSPGVDSTNLQFWFISKPMVSFRVLIFSSEFILLSISWILTILRCRSSSVPWEVWLFSSPNLTFFIDEVSISWNLPPVFEWH